MKSLNSARMDIDQLVDIIKEGKIESSYWSDGCGDWVARFGVIAMLE